MIRRCSCVITSMIKKKSILKIESNKRKKTKDSNLNDNEKEQIRKYEKTMCNNLDDEEKKNNEK